MDAAKLAFFKLIVKDLERMKTFYREAFGLREVNGFDTPDFEEAMLQQEGNDFLLMLLRYKSGGRDGDLTAHGPIGFVADNLQLAVDAALAAGATLKLAPFDVGEARVAFVLDPEGHEIEIIQFLQEAQ
jgi:lactoylglutathione lyase